MKRPLLILAALAAFGVAVAPVFSAHAEDDAAPAKPDAAKPDASKPDEGAAKGKGPGEVSGGRFAGDPIYVHLQPILLPVISDQGAEQLVTIVIDIEVKDFDVAENLQTNMPRVMDALTTHLYGGLGQGSLRDGKLVDVAKVKAKALDALSTVVGGDGIRDVLIQGVSQRML